MICKEYFISIQESTIFQPGVSQFPAYNVSRVGVEEGEMVATLNGSGDKQGRGVHTARMRAGESVTDEVSGTFTLVEVTPARYAAPGSREEFFGTRATADANEWATAVVRARTVSRIVATIGGGRLANSPCRPGSKRRILGRDERREETYAKALV